MEKKALAAAAARGAAVTALAAALLLGAAPDGQPGMSSALAADIVVNIDEASVHRLMREAATIVVGNPSIADVNVQGGTLLLVTGKNPGSTNIIALDRKGVEIENVDVHVRNSGNRRVTLHKGTSRLSYNCAPVCDRTLTVGDADTAFELLHKQTLGKSTVSQGSIGPAGAGQ